MPSPLFLWSPSRWLFNGIPKFRVVAPCPRGTIAGMSSPRAPLSLTLKAIVFAAALVSSSPAHAATVTVVDPSQSHGQWDGWGTSLCWWAKMFGDRDDLADLLFTTKTVALQGNPLPGLGLNIARYNAGACSPNEVDGHRMVVSKTILPFRQMEGFWLDGKSEDPQSRSWDWSVDKNQRAMLSKAQARGANRFELFSNSPMWWMCKNLNPSGQADASQDNLPSENYGRFAVYMATIARYAKDHWGVAFTTVEAFNEPTTKYWGADGKQEGCHFSTPTQAAVLPLLRRELDRRGLAETPIAASDESLYDQAVASWEKYDEPTKALVNQVNVHGYQGDGGRRDMLRQITEGKRLWNSEYGEIDGSGLELARHLHLDFRYLHPSAWCYWQPFDGKGWGLIMSDVPHKTLMQPNPKYFVVAQYTRHIRPGMTILDTGETETVAAYDAPARKLVLVTLNQGKEGTKTFDLGKFPEVKGPVTQWITAPHGTARHEVHPGLPVADKRLNVVLPADSVQTFEIENVTAP